MLIVLDLGTCSVLGQGPPTRRIAISVGSKSVRICTWNGIDPGHAHADYHPAPGSVVSVGDDVPVEVIQGRFAGGWHAYRRVGDECLLAHGDGTLFDESAVSKASMKPEPAPTKPEPSSPAKQPATQTRVPEDKALFYAIRNNGLVFATPERARYVSRLHSAMNAKSWGEFKRRIPASEWAAIKGNLADNGIRVTRTDRFDSSKVPGFCDGDWPPWLQQEMGGVLPSDILERYAKREWSVINGNFWQIEPKNLPAILRALKERGIRAQKAPELTFW
jgi:hypothetical protein